MSTRASPAELELGRVGAALAASSATDTVFFEAMTLGLWRWPRPLSKFQSVPCRRHRTVSVRSWQRESRVAAKAEVGMPGFVGTIGFVSARHPSRKDSWPLELDPGPAEWAVLEILWRQGPCSANAVAKALAASGRWSGAGAPTLLARLIESGLARYEDRRRRPMHVQAAVAKTALQEELCRRFAERHFAGDLKVLARTVQRTGFASSSQSGSSSSEMSQSSKAQG